MLLPLLLASLAQAGEIVVTMGLPVVVSVDGQVLQLQPGAGAQVKARNLDEGAHVVEARSAFGKLLAAYEVEVGAEELVRLRYQRKAFTEVERGAAAPSRADKPEPATAGVEEIQAKIEGVQAQIATMGGFSNATTTAPAGKPRSAPPPSPPAVEPAATGAGGSAGDTLASTTFTGIDPYLFQVFVDGKALPWVAAAGGYVVAELPVGSHHKFVMTLHGQTAWTADRTPDRAGHEICHILVQPFDYGISCSRVGPAITYADLAGYAQGEPVAVEAGPEAMADDDLSRLIDTVDDASFGADQVDVIRTAAAHNHFTCGQLVRLLEPISHSSDKVDAVKAARTALIDPNNAHELEAAFSFSSDKEEVRGLFQ